MESLPPEIKEYIFDQLNSETVEDHVAKVCNEWSELAIKILDSRVMKMLDYFHNSSVAVDFKSKLHSSIVQDDRKLLREYEKSIVSRKFEIRVRRNRGAGHLINNIYRTRKCDCQFVDKCLVRAISFMECHQLVIAQNPERMTFYSLNALENILDTSDEESYMEYTTSVLGSKLKNIWIDNNRHTAFTVYKDLIVSQETTRALILFKVSDVNHETRHVVLENVRRVFMPFWCSTLVMLEGKVCVFFTTGRVGVWKETIDEISVSGNTCASLDVIRRMQHSAMYRVNNLVFIKIVFDEGDDGPKVHWAVFDSNDCEEGFLIHSLCSINLLVDSYILDNSSETCDEIIDIFTSVNSIILYCKVCKSTSSRSTSASSRQLLVKRLRRELTLEDFVTPEKIANEICKEIPTPRINFNGSITMPMYVSSSSSNLKKNEVFKLHGLQKTINRPQTMSKDFMKLDAVSFEVLNI